MDWDLNIESLLEKSYKKIYHGYLSLFQFEFHHNYLRKLRSLNLWEIERGYVNVVCPYATQ